MGIADIFNENSLFKIRIVVYWILILLSFFIFVGVAVMKDKADDHCPLYIRTEMRGWYYGSSSNCEYPIAIAVIFQLVYLLFRIMTHVLLLLGKLNMEMFLFSDLLQFIYVVIDLVAFFLTFVGACILSAGSHETFDHPYPFSWESATEVALAGAWISVILWLVIGIIGFFVLWNAGKVPLVGGRRQAPSQPTGGQNQAEMVDPASEKFSI